VADEPVYAPPEFQADLRKLGGLPGSGLTGHDHHLVVPDGGEDVVLALADRQRLGIADIRDGSPPLCQAGRCRVDLGGYLVDGVRTGLGVLEVTDGVDAPAQPVLVEQHDTRQAGEQIGSRMPSAGAAGGRRRHDLARIGTRPPLDR
jgi:hypothetical protein